VVGTGVCLVGFVAVRCVVAGFGLARFYYKIL
jgi:hypothetical protein